MYRYHYCAPRRKYKKRSKKFNLFLVYILLVLLLFYSFTLFEIKLRPIIKSVSEAKAKNVAITVINDVVNEKLSESKITYNDLVVFQKGKSEQITAVSLNIVKINQIKAVLASSISDRMSKVDELKTKIPLGTLLNQGLFSGVGPKIPIKLVPLGYAKIDIKNSFSAAGINQTKHEIHLEVIATVNILLPFSSSTTQIETELPIAQTIIVGTVPETYTNIEGASGTAQDILINGLP